MIILCILPVRTKGLSNKNVLILKECSDFFSKIGSLKDYSVFYLVIETSIFYLLYNRNLSKNILLIVYFHGLQ